MKKNILLLFILMWMGFIFYFSHQPADTSTEQSSMVIDIMVNIPVIGEFIEEMDSQNHAIINMDTVSFVVRKAAHMFLYFVLIILSFLYIKETKYKSRAITYAFIITFLYACSDEIHQIFIPGRTGKISDVLVDTMGALVGILFIKVCEYLIGVRTMKKERAREIM